MTGVGIVVVTLNSGQYIGRCLDAALRTGASVVVVDNGSQDSTLGEVRSRPSVHLIANRRNRGFAGAVNQGVEALDTPFVLLLNPDAFIETPLDSLVAACSQPGAGAAGGRLIDETGCTQSGFVVRRFPTPAVLALEVLGLNRLWSGNPLNRRYRCLDLDLTQSADVDQPAGAFLMIRREVWERLGGFDERFFPAWYEDVDFCRRAAGAGWRILYEPRAVAVHVGGHWARTAPWEARRLIWNVNLLRYARKHFSGAGARAVSAALVAGSVSRLVPDLLIRRSLEPLRVHGRILRLAAGVLLGRSTRGMPA